jgi:chemotaxis signal transduction protein
MDYDFFLLTTFLMKAEDNKKQMHIRCLGSREILKINKDIPKNILGIIEFESSYIPVVDLGAAFGIEPIKIDSSKCILIVEHNYKSYKLYTGVIIQDFAEIEKLATGVYEQGAGLGASANMHFILEMQNSYNDGHEILLESHKILSLLKGSKTDMSDEYSDLQLSNSYDFINELGTMDFFQRQLILEELTNKPELWDRESNVMCL